MVNAALDGKLQDVAYETDELFHLQVPRECPNVPSEILNPANTWGDKKAYEERAKKLAAEFSDKFDKAYTGKNIPESIQRQCPGK
jgi:phosphoenolpyruvate carboxykinase (ATP)